MFDFYSNYHKFYFAKRIIEILDKHCKVYDSHTFNQLCYHLFKLWHNSISFDLDDFIDRFDFLISDGYSMFSISKMSYEEFIKKETYK